MKLPLEDLFNDVLGKAQRGLALDDATLASRAGIGIDALRDTRSGVVNDAVLTSLAKPLSLHGASLVELARGSWYPEPVSVDGLVQFNTVYHDMTVNAYVIWDPATKEAAAFDTGADAGPMIDFIQLNGLRLAHVFLTHTHPDHLLDLDRLSAIGAPAIHANTREPHANAISFEIGPQAAWQIGALRIEARSTWGHSKGGTTYVVTGLSRPIAVVGDALFASSMGGGMVSYADALATNRAEIFSLTDESIICPGHGPMTTVGEEKMHNPFYPEFKSSN